MKLAGGSGGGGMSNDDADDSSEDFEEPTRQMVHQLTNAEAHTHAASPQHRARMSGVLRNRDECDRVVREARPTEQETKEKSRCMEDLKQALRPQELHWTGSVGKSTALRGAHDLDVCVKLEPAFDGKAALNEIVRRLIGSPFAVVRKEAALVFVRYGSLELDIIPSSTHDKWTSQVGHLRLFKQMNPAFKDVVRLVKAWSRLCVPLLGIFIECVVNEVGRLGHTEGGSVVQKLFIQVMRRLSVRQQWMDPLRPENDLSSVLTEDLWRQLSSYAKSTLELLDVSAVEHHGCGFMTFPCQLQIQLVFKQEKCIEPVDLGMLDGFEIVELCTRLALRTPSFGDDATYFDQYKKPKRVRDAAKLKSKCFEDFGSNLIFADVLKKEFYNIPMTATPASTDPGANKDWLRLLFVVWAVVFLGLALFVAAFQR